MTTHRRKSREPGDPKDPRLDLFARNPEDSCAFIKGSGISAGQALRYQQGLLGAMTRWGDPLTDLQEQRTAFFKQFLEDQVTMHVVANLGEHRPPGAGAWFGDKWGPVICPNAFQNEIYSEEEMVAIQLVQLYEEMLKLSEESGDE